MTDDDLEQKVNAMISEYVEHRERAKIHVSGDIYRLPGVCSNPEGVWYELWRMDVWDDEFSTTITCLEQNPPADSIVRIFRELKSSRRLKDLGDTPTP